MRELNLSPSFPGDIVRKRKHLSISWLVFLAWSLKYDHLKLLNLQGKFLREIIVINITLYILNRKSFFFQ